LTARLAEVATGQVADAGGITIGEYLTAWMEGLPGQVEAKTAEWYRWVVRRHLIPTLGRIHLDRLTPVDVDRLLAERKRAGIGTTTLRAIRVTLGKALGDAVRKGLLYRNPVELADRPKSQKRDATVIVWTPQEVGVFMRSVTGDRLAAMWRTAAMTGMRRSEICGLYWADLDLEQGALSVRRAVVVVEGHPHVKSPKTAKSRRTVELDMGTVVALKEWRRCQLEERLRAGEAWEIGEWVFTDELGQPVNPEWVGKKFRRLVATTSLPSITMRQLRHSHATALLRAGVHPKVVQERLGHSSIGVTLDIYSSVLPTMQREAVERLIALIDG
jgi:integrase